MQLTKAAPGDTLTQGVQLFGISVALDLSIFTREHPSGERS